MNLLRLYLSCGIVNSLFIAPTNFYYSCKMVHKHIIDELRYTDNAFDRVMSPIAIGLFESFGNGIGLSAKTLYFFALGPIGTYRILLAYQMYNKTNDYGWIRVLMKPYSSLYSKNDAYIMAPFGQASWKLE
jgi:hypothetical protein